MLAVAPATSMGQEWTDTVQAGRFDNGKMWTFEAPPADYFQEAYGIEADAAWFERARLGSLRVPGCSASFVSSEGLVMTNHHCARGSISQVAGPGESFLDDGFYAATRDQERRIEDYHADQLVEIRDVTDRVNEAVAAAGDDPQARAQARESAVGAVEEEVLGEYGGENGGHVVEVISLYNGGRTSAYVFRRFEDVRLVFAPELQIGFFGGDPDNFTYPRYNLDMSFYRIYEGGDPYRPEVFFPFSSEGVSEGDVVFVIGNPGSTSRLQTVAELEFRRDVSDKAVLDFIDSRVEVLGEFIAAEPEVAEELDLRNSYFSLANSQKAYGGQIKGLPISLPGERPRRGISKRLSPPTPPWRPSMEVSSNGWLRSRTRCAALRASTPPSWGPRRRSTAPQPSFGRSTHSSFWPAGRGALPPRSWTS
jgi:hypothetical protein